MPRIKVSTSKNSKSYSIIEDYCRNGKRTTKIVDYIGNYSKVMELAKKENLDINTWLKKYLIQYKKEHNIPIEFNEVIIKKYSNKLIPKNVLNRFNIGYLFLKDIYYSLKIDIIIKMISKKYKFNLI